MDSPTGHLRRVLLYHIIPAYAPADRIAMADGEELNTLAGEPIEVTVDGKDIVLNGTANVYGDLVVQPYMVVHIVDEVLIPLEEEDDDETFYEHWHHGDYTHGHWYPYHPNYKHQYANNYSDGSKYHHKPMIYKHGYGKCSM
jgi:hypothetical protein